MTRNHNPHSTDDPDGEKPHLDTYVSVLSSIQEQIRFADSKAGFVAAFHVLLFGFIVSHADKLHSTPVDQRGCAFWVGCVLLALYGLTTLTAVTLVVFSVMSRFGDLAPQCEVFFGHITKQYGKDYEKYWTKTSRMCVGDWAKEFSGQIVETSHIAAVKHRLVKLAAVFTLVALLFWTAAFVALMLLSK